MVTCSILKLCQYDVPHRKGTMFSKLFNTSSHLASFPGHSHHQFAKTEPWNGLGTRPFHFKKFQSQDSRKTSNMNMAASHTHEHSLHTQSCYPVIHCTEHAVQASFPHPRDDGNRLRTRLFMHTNNQHIFPSHQNFVSMYNIL